MTEVVWIYGPSGVGKTKYILDEAKKHDDNTISIVDHVRGKYVEGFISNITKVVIIDNYSEEMMTIDSLLKMIDGGDYILKGEGGVWFNPQIVYISCLYEPERCLQVYTNKKLTKHQQLKIEELKDCITSFVHLTA